MSRLIHVVRGLVSELKRRKVFRVVGVYAVVAFVVVQVADIVFPALHLPGWTVTLVVALAILGFPIALVLAWALEVTPDGVKRTEPAPTRAPGANTGGRDSRRIAIGLVVAFFLAVAGLGAYGWISSSESGAAEEGALDPHRVAVFPFTVRGSPELEYLGESMVELLGRSLDGAGPLRVSDPHALLSRVARESAGAALSPADAEEIAAGFGAGRYILGSVVRVGDEIRLSATWYGGGDEEIGTAEATADGEGEIKTSIESLARSIISSLAGRETDHRERLAAQTTASVEALKAYLEGQTAYRRKDFLKAQEAYGRAVEIDPTFALAHNGLGRAASWNGFFDVGHRAAAAAVALSDELPTRDRRFLHAFHAFIEGRAEEAERLYRLIVDADPNDVQAWHWLGEVLFHLNGTRGRPVEETREYFEIALQLDPTHHEPLFHLIELAALDRDWARLDSLTTGLEERNLGSPYDDALATVRAHVRGEVEISAPNLGHVFGGFILLLAGEAGKAVELTRPMTRSDQDPEVRGAAHIWIADMLAAQGQLQAGRRELEAVAPLDRATYLKARGRLATLPFVPGGEDVSPEQGELLNAITEWDADTVPDRLLPGFFLLPSEVFPPARVYLMGLLRAGAADFRGASEAAEDLGIMTSSPLISSGPHDLARAVEAEVARRQDEPEQALRQLEALQFHIDPVLVRLSLYAGPRERFLRAELLRETGRFEEALPWYGTLNGVELRELPFIAPAHLGRARALEALDRPEEAVEAYERFLELWRDADPELQPMVREARVRLEQHLGAGNRDGGRQVNPPQALTRLVILP